MSDEAAPHIPEHAGRSAVSALLAVARAPDWDRILGSVPSIIQDVLRTGAIPAPVAMAAIARGRDHDLVTLLRRPQLVRDLPDVLDRVYATGDPQVYRVAGLDDRHKVIAHAHRSRQSWTRLRRELLRRSPGTSDERQRDLRRHLIHAPFPELVKHALDLPNGALSERETVLALRRLHELAGREEALDSAVRLGGVVGDRAAAALGAGDDLDALTEWAEGPECTARELRAADRDDRAWLLRRRATLDWAELAAEHARDPFDAEAAGLLAARPDCPDTMIVALFEHHPAVIAERAHRVTAELWRSRRSGGAAAAARATRLLAGRAIAEGGTEDLLTEATPAVAVLDALRTSRNEHRENVAPLEAALRELVAPLGGDPAAWRALRAALASARNLTVAEVVATAMRTLGAGRAPKTWPNAAAVPAGGRTPSPSGPRSAFVPLFDAAAPDARLAVLPHLDDRTRHDVLVHGLWRPEWLGMVAADGARSARLMLAGRADLDADAIQCLLELDDPAVNARLFLRTAATSRQRAAILAGTRFGPGDGPVPLDPGLRERLLDRDAGFRGTDVIACADAELQVHLLGRVRVRGDMPQARMLLDAWDRHGRDHVRRLMSGGRPGGFRTAYKANPVNPRTARRFTALLDAEDPATGLAALREEVAYAETAEWQLATIRGVPDDGPGPEPGPHHTARRAAVRGLDDKHVDFAKQSHHWHWPEIVAAHREERLAPWMVYAFAQHTAGCPGELHATAAALGPMPVDGEAWKYPDVGPDEVERRLNGALGGDDEAKFWLRTAIGEGAVSAEEVLRRATPAAIVLHALNGRADAELSDLAASTIGDDADAWVLALRMIGDFRGSVAELLDTVAAALS